jgi:hypothetical protein
MPRKPPTDSELVEYSHHVIYEIEQFAGAVEKLAAAKIATGGPESVIANSLLENVVLHARNLIEFAYETPRKAKERDYVVAADYIPTWPQDRPTLTAFLRNVKQRAGREILHMTRGRLVPDEVREWEYGQVHNEISDLMVPFILGVPKEKVRNDFPSRARNAFPAARAAERRAFSSPRPMAIEGPGHSVPTRSLITGDLND